MNATIIPSPEEFAPFSVRIDIEDEDQLRAFTTAAGRMCNGHGNQLYDLLASKCHERGIKADA